MYDTATSAFSYLHGDHLGSAGLATNAAGGLAQSQEYDAWGKVRSGGISLTDINYTGQRLDLSGLLNYNARMYDPNLGRFISADSIVPGAGRLTLSPHDAIATEAWSQGGGGPSNPQDLNRYSYALNNPLKYTDPSGHLLQLNHRQALDMKQLLFPLLRELDSIFNTAQGVMDIAVSVASAIGGVISTAKNHTLGTVGGEGADIATSFLGSVLTMVTDPTGAQAAYDALSFVAHIVDTFLDVGDKDGILNLWLSRKYGDSFIKAHYSSPYYQIQRELEIHYSTYDKLYKSIGGLVDLPDKPRRRGGQV
jgi:RHS repeat-associated protein